MPPRLYCPQLTASGTVTLPETEAHHAKDVLRLSIGGAVELFDGKGLIAEASVQAIRRNELVCQIAASHTEPEPMPRITLATAVPKGERFDWLVEKATELGVSRLIPLQTERSSVDPRDSKLTRLRQTIIAACKQSRRAHLMDLSEVMTWRRLLETAGRDLIVADPGGPPLAASLPNASGKDVIFAVGPEGGFTSSEIDGVKAVGGRLVNLGQHLLRIETAGLVLAGWSAIQRRSRSDS